MLVGSGSARLAALLFAAIFLPTMGALGFMQLASERTLAEQRAALVTELRDELVVEYDGGGARGLAAAIKDRLDFNPLGEEVMSYADAGGRIVVGNLSTWPALPRRKERWEEVELVRTGDKGPRPVVVLVSALPDGSHLLTGHVASGSSELAAANRWALLLAFLVALPLSVGLAYVLLRVIERRAAAITRIAERVGAGDLSQRLQLGDGDDAFARLGRGLNAMFERIETLVSELRLVTDGLAHDLRSPVTRLQGVIERAAAKVDDDAASDALESARQEAAHLQAMLTAALQISRAEAGIGRDRFTPVELATALNDTVEIYGPLAEDSGVELAATAEPGLTMPMHRELLGQALGNLVENALRYADGATRVVLGAATEGSDVVISVTDDGIGIAADQREEAMRRFGRLDPARQQSGSGLGLALVEAAAKLHGGRLDLADAAPGLSARIVLPLP
ncbi:sensor histidine kinase [Croceibacterium aestuarii]|uniref:sensor histidine kinase n=1 Tax=Croceibacterium aestuarii TaxID=3064139 RepID=UPI00272EB1D6|nr:HAMP domain-containing sensor histidine kinase [Croceibacterium sp. D39]